LDLQRGQAAGRPGADALLQRLQILAEVEIHQLRHRLAVSAAEAQMIRSKRPIVRMRQVAVRQADRVQPADRPAEGADVLLGGDGQREVVLRAAADRPQHQRGPAVHLHQVHGGGQTRSRGRARQARFPPQPVGPPHRTLAGLRVQLVHEVLHVEAPRATVDGQVVPLGAPVGGLVFDDARVVRLEARQLGARGDQRQHRLGLGAEALREQLRRVELGARNGRDRLSPRLGAAIRLSRRCWRAPYFRRAGLDRRPGRRLSAPRRRPGPALPPPAAQPARQPRGPPRAHHADEHERLHRRHQRSEQPADLLRPAQRIGGGRPQCQSDEQRAGRRVAPAATRARAHRRGQRVGIQRQRDGDPRAGRRDQTAALGVDRQTAAGRLNHAAGTEQAEAVARAGVAGDQRAHVPVLQSRQPPGLDARPAILQHEYHALALPTQPDQHRDVAHVSGGARLAGVAQQVVDHAGIEQPGIDPDGRHLRQVGRLDPQARRQGSAHHLGHQRPQIHHLGLAARVAAGIDPGLEHVNGALGPLAHHHQQLVLDHVRQPLDRQAQFGQHGLQLHGVMPQRVEVFGALGGGVPRIQGRMGFA
jgi:hypothetical protein